MATTTPNYGWSVPTSTDLVKDGAVAIETLGDSADATVKALNPETTLGDIAYRSSTANTNTRLAVGSTGQVLTVAGGVPSWATPSAGALTLITTTTFSNVASQAFDSIFTSTYKTYFVAINEITSANALDDLQLQFRYAGPTTQTSGYYGSAVVTDPNAASTGTASYNAAQVTLCTATGGTDQGAGIIYFNRVGDSSTNPVFQGRFLDASGSQSSFGGKVDSARVYTGFLLKSSSSNITGSVSIYGLAL